MHGTVSRHWRDPVKSLLGEECRELAIEPRGVAGDRLYALRDAEGKLGSGKNTRRMRQIDGLFSLRARSRADGKPEILFPDGRWLPGDDPGIHWALSSLLGVDVTLAREASVSHFDSSPVHLVITRALGWLRARLPSSKVDERRFRPNLVVETDEDEQAWLGRVLRVGDVRLRGDAPTERCRMTTLPQSDLPNDPKILRCVAQAAGLNFGVYAQVLTPGAVAIGDRVSLEEA
jgi:uncharacterized protein YcbX